LNASRFRGRQDHTDAFSARAIRASRVVSARKKSLNSFKFKQYQLLDLMRAREHISA
jgi:hypothetical protein